MYERKIWYILRLYGDKIQFSGSVGASYDRINNNLGANIYASLLGNFYKKSSCSVNESAFNEYFELTNNKKTRIISYDVKKQLYKLEFKIKNDKNDLKSWWQLGKLYQLLKEYKQAESAFFNAHKLKPSNTTAGKIEKISWRFLFILIPLSICESITI